MFAIVVQVNAQSLPARIGQQIAAVVKNKVGLRGFAANDPRYGATVAAVGTAVVEIGTAVAVAGTAPAWGTVLASAAIAGAVGYGLQALSNWLFNKDGTVTIPASGSAPPVAGAGNCFRNAQGGACYNSVSDVLTGGSGAPAGYTNQYGTYTFSLGFVTCEPLPGLCQMPINGLVARADNSSGSFILTTKSAYVIVVQGVGLPLVNADVMAGSTPAQTVPVAQALGMISDSDKAKPLPDQVIADLADAAWRQAASQPGYAGVPYSLTDPVTQADVGAARAANPSVPQATVGDLAEPVSSSNPLGQSAPSTSPSTNPASSSPQVNLGDDPGIGFPTLEATPTAQQIIDPLAGLAPSLKNWAVPAHVAECPRPAFDLFNKHIVMDQQCALFDANRATLYNAMLVVWALIALFIVLSA
ncbi:hypothetical protein [Duganella sp. BuS-21]|uniref:hypothetical protein n=1 Tax=Duganella sp. BuS-21 TaxID=2943848 RepID=UPI0035A5AF44